MPQNGGGVCMFRSEYAAEGQADDFDFESIEALKVAIEAGGSPKLYNVHLRGAHK